MIKLKQREGAKVIITPLAKRRMEKNQCPACGKHKSKWNRRTDWRCCSVKCTDKFLEENGFVTWAEIREKALKRDNYTCVKCSKQPTTIKYHNVSQKDILIKQLEDKMSDNWAFKQFLVVDTSKLVGDHIVPIALNGEEFELSNVQTLCLDCDKKKTRVDLQKISKERYKKKVLRHHYSLDSYGEK